jgi:hypothetical protein
MAGNREYKSDVFSMLMEDKKYALQVYNALNGSDYDDPELVEICNLDRGISLSVRNDASFVVDANLNIYEHQSTVCPNMPLRNLIYVTEILKPLARRDNVFGSRLLKIPTPKFAVFYNGTQDEPEQYEMKLSDAYEHPSDRPELELICRMYNINKGRNKELMDKCPVLFEYAVFVDYVRQYNMETGYDDLEKAVNKAIDRCIEEGVLKEFLTLHRAEVVKTMPLDFTFERQIMLEKEYSRKEGLEEGHAEGFTNGKLETLILLISKKKVKNCTVSETADMLETDEALVRKVYDALEMYNVETQREDIIKLIKQDMTD